MKDYESRFLLQILFFLFFSSEMRQLLSPKVAARPSTTDDERHTNSLRTLERYFRTLQPLDILGSSGSAVWLALETAIVRYQNENEWKKKTQIQRNVSSLGANVSFNVDRMAAPTLSSFRFIKVPFNFHTTTLSFILRIGGTSNSNQGKYLNSGHRCTFNRIGEGIGKYRIHTFCLFYAPNVSNSNS